VNIDNAVRLAATRWRNHAQAQGRYQLEPSGGWQEWTRNARHDAQQLTRDYQLTESQLADALVNPNAGWLRFLRRSS
jgi:hypothetical protein